MKRFATVAAGPSTVLALLLALTPPPLSAAASDTKVSLMPVNDTADQLETHSWVDCKPAGAHCDFTAGVRLRTPEGLTGFPDGLYARQTIEVRSAKRSVYLDVHTNGGTGIYGDRGGPGTKVFKEGGTAVIQSIFRGEGPPEKYQTNGVVDAVDQSTGQPKTDANVIVCTHVQVVYSGVNLITPDTCAVTRFS